MAKTTFIVRTLLASAALLLGLSSATAQSPAQAKGATKTMGTNPAMPVWEGPWDAHH